MTAIPASPRHRPPIRRFVRGFDTLDGSDRALIGGKNASVAALARLGLPVPYGFAITRDAFRALLDHNDLLPALAPLVGRPSAEAAQEIRRLLLEAEFPPGLEDEVCDAYHGLGGPSENDPPEVAVRSSVAALDAPDACFADQFDSYLGLCGCREVLHAFRRCIASLFGESALRRHAETRRDPLELCFSVAVQRMVRSDLGRGASGIAYREPGDDGEVVILACHGLGECLVRGIVTPDEFRVRAGGPAETRHPVLEKRLGAKEVKMVQSGPHASLPRTIPVAAGDRNRFSLEDSQALQLARWTSEVARCHGRPMLLEWALDGEIGRLFLLQARPHLPAAAGLRREPRPLSTAHGPFASPGAPPERAILAGAP